MDNSSRSSEFWHRKASGLLVKIAAGAWLSRFIPLMVLISFLSAVSLVIVRSMGGLTAFVWDGFAVTALVALLVSFLLSRRSPVTREQALVHLDAVLETKNRLISARNGIGSWPLPLMSRAYRDGLKWNWSHIAAPVFLCAAVLTAGWYVPVPKHTFELPGDVEEPVAWQEVEEWLENIKEEEIVDERSLERWQEKVENLRSRPEQEWYSHSSLEAGDHLKDRLENALMTLNRQLEEAEQILNEAVSLGDNMDSARLREMSDRMDAIVSGLKMSDMPLNEEMLRKLGNCDLAALKQMPREKLQELQNCLQCGQGVCTACLGMGEGTELPGLTEGIVSDAGAGGIDRGPGTAPLGLRNDATDMGTTRTEASSNDDMSRPAIGDVVGVGKGDHDIDDSEYTGPVEAGKVGSRGEGGEVVWRASLYPEEQEILQRYFK